MLRLFSLIRNKQYRRTLKNEIPLQQSEVVQCILLPQDLAIPYQLVLQNIDQAEDMA